MKRRAFVAGSAALLLPRPGDAATLFAVVQREANDSSGVTGVYARTMAVGPAAIAVAYNADEIFPAASVIKLLILVTLFQEVDKQPGLLDERITLKASDFVGGSEFLQNASPGDVYTIRALATAMIAVSDNTASNTLISYFGFERINATAIHAELAHTQLKRHFLDYTAIVHHSQNWTSPRDIGTLLYLIERGSREAIRTVASPASCRHMIRILLMQEDRDKIARGLPHGIPLANKTGEIDGVRNDVGIIDPFGDSPYVLAVLTKELGDISSGVYAIRRIAGSVHAAIYP